MYVNKEVPSECASHELNLGLTKDKIAIYDNENVPTDFSIVEGVSETFLPIFSLVNYLLGICIGCIIAKINIIVCVVGYYVPTCFRHSCKMLDTMFQHPGMVQCA